MAEVTAHAHPPMPEQHPERHESGGLGFFMIFSIVASLIALAIVMFFVLYWLFGVFDRRDTGMQPPLTAVRQAPLSSPEPRLQGIPDYHANSPAIDLAAMREHNAAVLNSYGPTSEPGFVRIPIDRAMELGVEKNLLAPQTQPATSSSLKGGAGASR
jgi:hypothetical protein